MNPSRPRAPVVPAFPQCRPLELSDQGTVREALAADPPEISDFTFACLWIWRRTLPVDISALDGGLVFVIRSDRCPSYALPPIAVADPVGVARRVLDSLRAKEGPLAGLRLVPEALASALQSAGLHVEDDRAATDYVYRSADLVDLPGRRYDAKRNWIRRCLATHACAYEPIRGPVVAECATYMEEWCADRDCAEDVDLCAEATAVREAFAQWEELGLAGGAIRVRGDVRGFAVGERLSGTMGVQHFEKADARVPGLYQVVNQWFTREAFADVEWVNREEDLGNPGLRKAKQSYHPTRMVKKFLVTG